MKKLIFIVIVSLLISSILLSACTSTQPTEQPAAEEPAMEEPAAEEPTEEEAAELPDLGVIKVGFLPMVGQAPLFVAKELGYFDEQGLEVEMEQFVSGSKEIAPLSLGQLDVGNGETGPALFNAVNQGLDVKVVASGLAQPEGHGATPFVVCKDLLDSGEVSDASDLEGRNVALNIEGGMAEYLTAKVLEKAGLTIDDVTIVVLPFPEQIQALANGAIDGSILPQPLASKALRPGENDEPPIAGILYDGDEITDYPQNGALYYGQRLLDPANHEICVRFMVAYLLGARELQGDAWRENQEIIDAIVKYTNVPEAAVSKGVAFYFNPNGEMNLASTEDIQNYQVSRGYPEYSEPLPLDQIIYDQCRQDALERIGDYQP